MTATVDRVVVCIVTYNSAASLPGLLDSISAGMRGVDNYGVIVVDNDSRDASPHIALAHELRPTVIEAGRNGGYAAAINAAAAKAGPDAHLLILNPDLRLHEGAVAPLLACLGASATGIAVPCNFKEDGTLDPTIRREPSVLSAWSDSLLGGRLAARLGLGEIVDDIRAYDDECTIEWATGSALLVSAAARKAAGEWDESYFLYSEEVDYQRKVRECGLKIRFVPQSRVMHIGGDYHRNPRLYALLISNRIRYFRRHHDPVSSLFFRVGVAFGEAMRSWRGPSNRAALACALRPLRPALDFRG